MHTKTTWCALCATLLLTTACTTAKPTPDPNDAPSEPKVTPVLDEATGASIDAFFEAEVNDSTFVPIYLGDLGVAVDGKEAVRFDPETGRVAVADKKGGAGSLYIEVLEEPFKAASKARPLSAEEKEITPFLGANFYVEPFVPYRTFVEVLYTAGQWLESTGPESTNNVVILGGPGLRIKATTRTGDTWRGFNASSPKLSVGPPDEPEVSDEPPLNLTLGISARGVRVSAEGGNLPPISGCPADGPTVCNEGGADASDLIAKVASTQGAERDAALGELVAAYDMHSLYNTAVRIKNAYPEETVFTVTADPDVPFTLVAAVVHAVRDRRDAGNAKGYFADDAAFEAAAPSARSFTSGGGLFPDPVFGVVQ